MRVLLDHLVPRQAGPGTVWSEVIILFLKQPDFFFRILERKNQLTFKHSSRKAAVE